MAKFVIMPKIGLTMTEGTIGSWYKNEGDTIAAGEKLFDIKTDKLTNDIESEEAGVLLRILAKAGDVVGCLKPVGIIGQAGEDISDLLNSAGAEKSDAAALKEEKKDEEKPADEAAPQTRDGRVIASPAAKKLAAERGIDLHLVTGHGPGGRIVLADVEGYTAADSGKAPKASPMARKLAGELGVDLNEVPAKGRIMKADVAAWAKAGAGAATEHLEEIVPMTMMRKVIANRMSESWAVSPVVTYDISIDMTELARLKNSLKPYRKVTYTDILVKIVSKALLEYPYLNCSIDGENFVLKRYVNMGIAVAVKDGLLVPVIKDAHLKGLAEISESVADLAARAKNNTLTSDDMTGGTFTITNLGMFGIESFSPIINQPEAAILGVNTIQDVVYLKEDGSVASRPMMKLSLTADHRAVDGALAAQFLQRVKALAEAPGQLLL